MTSDVIESAAVGAVKTYINYSDMLSARISENDKTPIWDGDIFVYSSNKKKNNDFYGRVPVQVKGRAVTRFAKEKTSFKQTRRELENFRKDGGCIFFFVQILKGSKEPPRVFYRELSVAVITDMLNKKEKKKNQKYYSFQLIHVPDDNREFSNKVVEFSDKRYKNLVVREMREIEGLEKRIDELLEIVKFIFEKKEYKSYFSTYIAEIKKMKDERESIWKAIKENYVVLIAKSSKVVDDSIRAEIKLHANYLLSNLYNCEYKWLDRFLVWMPEIIEEASDKVGDSDLYGLIFHYAQYLLSQKKYHLLNDYYNRALDIAKNLCSPDSPSWSVAETHFAMANLNKNLNRYREAIKEYDETLHIYLTKYLNVEYLTVALNCVHNMALLYSKLNNPEAAKVLYDSLQKSLKALANDDPSYFNWDLFCAFVNIGSFYKDQNQFDEMLKAFVEAKRILNKLPRTLIAADEESVASIHENLGIFYQESYLNNKAEKEYQEAMKMYKTLAKDNRDVYLDKEAMIHKRLANLYSENDVKKAESEYNAALNIYEELADVNPVAYKLECALILTDLANFYMENNRSKAKKKYDDALKIFIELGFEDVPYGGDVADICYNLGQLYVDSGDYLNAEKVTTTALEIHKVLVKANPQKYKYKFLRDYYELLTIVSEIIITHDKPSDESLAIVLSFDEVLKEL